MKQASDKNQLIDPQGQTIRIDSTTKNKQNDHEK